MSHSQFHCTGRAYLDMHGLIFETSICYWQDQPGRSAGKAGETARADARPSLPRGPDVPERASRGWKSAGRGARPRRKEEARERRGEARRGAAGAGRAGDRGRAPDTHPATGARARRKPRRAPGPAPGPDGTRSARGEADPPRPAPDREGRRNGRRRGGARGGPRGRHPDGGRGSGLRGTGQTHREPPPAGARATPARGDGGPGPEAPEPPPPGGAARPRGGGRRLTTAGRDPSRRSGAPFRTRAAQRGDGPDAHTQRRRTPAGAPADTEAGRRQAPGRRCATAGRGSPTTGRARRDGGRRRRDDRPRRRGTRGAGEGGGGAAGGPDREAAAGTAGSAKQRKKKTEAFPSRGGGRAGSVFAGTHAGSHRRRPPSPGAVPRQPREDDDRHPLPSRKRRPKPQPRERAPAAPPRPRPRREEHGSTVLPPSLALPGPAHTPARRHPAARAGGAPTGRGPRRANFARRRRPAPAPGVGGRAEGATPARRKAPVSRGRAVAERRHSPPRRGGRTEGRRRRRGGEAGRAGGAQDAEPADGGRGRARGRRGRPPRREGPRGHGRAAGKTHGDPTATDTQGGPATPGTPAGPPSCGTRPSEKPSNAPRRCTARPRHRGPRAHRAARGSRPRLSPSFRPGPTRVETRVPSGTPPRGQAGHETCPRQGASAGLQTPRGRERAREAARSAEADARRGRGRASASLPPFGTRPQGARARGAPTRTPRAPRNTRPETPARPGGILPRLGGGRRGPR